ncbi:MAG: hypothetical protein M3014_10240 [Chloroflexota bacterium]|nr:hypothetical protein [Chloroflexota bacterium]
MPRLDNRFLDACCGHGYVLEQLNGDDVAGRVWARAGSRPDPGSWPRGLTASSDQSLVYIGQ